MANHHWLVERAIRLQGEAITELGALPASFAVLLRYQVTNERASTCAQLRKNHRTNASRTLWTPRPRSNRPPSPAPAQTAPQS